jgi:hypothetical protein
LRAGFGDEDKEGFEELGGEGGPAEASIAEQGVGSDGFSRA